MMGVTRLVSPNISLISYSHQVVILRVYSAKHELFYNDVTNCFHALKKAVHEMQRAGGDHETEHGPCSVRLDTVTLNWEANPFDLLQFDMLEPVRKWICAYAFNFIEPS